MARRQLLTDGERRLLLGVPEEPDALTRHYSLTRSDLELLAERRGRRQSTWASWSSWRLLRHPGIALASMEEPVAALVTWLAERLEIPTAAFADYTRPPADHDRSCAHARRRHWGCGPRRRRSAVHDRGSGAGRLEH